MNNRADIRFVHPQAVGAGGAEHAVGAGEEPLFEAALLVPAQTRVVEANIIPAEALPEDSGGPLYR